MSSASRQQGELEEFVAHLRNDVGTLHFGVEQPLASLETAQLGRAQAGSIDVLQYTGHGVQWGNRRPDHIRAEWADYYLICLPLTATLAVRQNGAEAVLKPGHFTFLDMSRPFWGEIRPVDASHGFSSLHARIPGSLLRRSMPCAADICGQEIELQRGDGKLMQTLLHATLYEGPHLSARQNARLGNMLLDTICEVALPMGKTACQRRSARIEESSTYERASQFIRARLSDPQLNSDQVAAHCSVSLRYLQATFKAASSTVGAHIRDSRLEACRAALRDPALRRRSISELARGWGFEDHSHFCRLYKKKFNRTPRQEREAR